ncbi:putative dipeptidase [Lachnellula subtilissima]|uniref:Dipeptidase n=1 Tax=Lachnellula subtilissima TaxID=602034 RepID=A0A8H8RKE2_9HELO|nr:putative dipeptidase [Lachnellula subtilissima]
MEPRQSRAGAIPEDGLTRENPRYALKITSLLMLLGAISAVAFPYLGYSFQGQKIDALDYEGRVKHILDTTPLIDGHNDLPYLLRIELQNKIYDAEEFNFWDGENMIFLLAGFMEAGFWWDETEVDWCPDTRHFDDPDHAVRDTIEQIDVAKRLFAHHSTNLTYCTTSACAISSFKSKRIASMLGAEGLHQAGSALASIRQFFLLGVRYITLTHNCDNAFATAASTVTAGGKDNGLTEFGYAAVKEMNRLGMMVDLSHVSHDTMRDVLRVTRSPVMFSHSACYALARSYRNVPDDVLSGLRENGGVVMVMFVKRFLNAVDPESADMQTAVDHIFHVADTAGWEHVGIGADFDGTVTLADGIDDVTAYPRLIQAVMERGATDGQIRGLVGENILRVWRDNEMNAAAFEAAGELPVEDVWVERRFSRWDNPLPLMLPGNKKRVKAENYV